MTRPSDLPSPAVAADAARSGGADAAPGAVSAGELQRTAARGSLWTIIHVASSVPIAFLANRVIVRVLDTTQYGDLAVLMLLVGIATATTNLGVSEGVLQWGAAMFARGDTSGIERLLRQSLAYHVLVQWPLLGAVVTWLAWPHGLPVVLSLLTAVTLSAWMGSVVLRVTIEGRSASAAKLAIVTNLANQVLTTLVAVTTRSAGGVWAARSIGGSMALPAYLALLPRGHRRLAFGMAAFRSMPAGFWRFSVLAGASALVGVVVLSRSEVLVLDFYGISEAAGLYALAYALAQQFTAPIDALLTPLLPAVAGIVAAHPDRVSDTLLRATRISAVAAAGLCCTALPILSLLIPTLYGTQWAAAAGAFLVLAATSCIQSVVNPLVAFTRARKQSGTLLKVGMTAFLIDIALAFSLIPVLGLWGAVLANTAAQATMLVILAIVECRASRIRLGTYLMSVAPLFVAAVVAAGASLAAMAFRIPLAFAIAGAVLLSTMILVVTLRAAKTGLHPADVDAIVDTLPRRLQSVARTVFACLVSQTAGSGPRTAHVETA